MTMLSRSFRFSGPWRLVYSIVSLPLVCRHTACNEFLEEIVSKQTYRIGFPPNFESDVRVFVEGQFDFLRRFVLIGGVVDDFRYELSDEDVHYSTHQCPQEEFCY